MVYIIIGIYISKTLNLDATDLVGKIVPFYAWNTIIATQDFTLIV